MLQKIMAILLFSFSVAIYGENKKDFEITNKIVVSQKYLNYSIKLDDITIINPYVYSEILINSEYQEICSICWNESVALRSKRVYQVDYG